MTAARVVHGWVRLTGYLHAGHPEDGHLLAARILQAAADHGLVGGAMFAGVHGYSDRYASPRHGRRWHDQPVMVSMVGPAAVVAGFIPTVTAMAPRTLLVTDHLASVRLYGTAADAAAE